MAQQKRWIWIAGIAIVVIIAALFVLSPKISCESKGGIWGTIGLDQKASCNLPTTDGGKACTDGSQCQAGVCIAPTPQEGIIAAKPPTCPSYKRVVGCFNIYTNNEPPRTLCVD